MSNGGFFVILIWQSDHTDAAIGSRRFRSRIVPINNRIIPIDKPDYLNLTFAL